MPLATPGKGELGRWHRDRLEELQTQTRLLEATQDRLEEQLRLAVAEASESERLNLHARGMLEAAAAQNDGLRKAIRTLDHHDFGFDSLIVILPIHLLVVCFFQPWLHSAFARLLACLVPIPVVAIIKWKRNSSPIKPRLLFRRLASVRDSLTQTPRLNTSEGRLDVVEAYAAALRAGVADRESCLLEQGERKHAADVEREQIEQQVAVEQALRPRLQTDLVAAERAREKALAEPGDPGPLF